MRARKPGSFQIHGEVLREQVIGKRCQLSGAIFGREQVGVRGDYLSCCPSRFQPFDQQRVCTEPFMSGSQDDFTLLAILMSLSEGHLECGELFVLDDVLDQQRSSDDSGSRFSDRGLSRPHSAAEHDCPYYARHQRMVHGVQRDTFPFRVVVKCLLFETVDLFAEGESHGQSDKSSFDCRLQSLQPFPNLAEPRHLVVLGHLDVFFFTTFANVADVFLDGTDAYARRRPHRIVDQGDLRNWGRLEEIVVTEVVERAKSRRLSIPGVRRSAPEV